MRWGTRDTRDVVEFEYELKGGQRVWVIAKGKVIEGDYFDPRRSIQSFDWKAYSDRAETEEVIVKEIVDVIRIEDQACDEIYGQFDERKESA